MKGLTDKEVIDSRKKNGSNVITKVKKDSFFKMLISTLGDPIIKILLIALAIKTLFLFSNFDWYETVGIVIAIFLASFISTLSEYGSEKAFEKLEEDASKIKAKVKRGSVIKEVCIDDIVCGDLVILQAGDKICADGIILSGNILVNESNLNGEMKEKAKVSKSKVYRSTVVYSGRALMKVLKVGDNTVYGKLAREVMEKGQDSPLKIRLTHLAKQISKIGYMGALLVSISYLFSVVVIENDYNLNLIFKTLSNFPLMFGHLLHALTLSVTIIVVSVPEGLPMMITLVLSSNMRRMLKSNVLVRKLTGIETAGNINVLFTDKTGTITKGNLEVIQIVNYRGKCYRTLDELKRDKVYYNMCLLSLTSNNESTYSSNEAIGGNITDRAIMNFFNGENLSYSVLSRTPFSSELKYSCCEVSYNNRVINLIKGAPEVIIDKCTHYYENGRKYTLLSKNRINKTIKDATDRGMRVLAFGISDSRRLSSVSFLGLLFIKDEVRSEVYSGIKLIDGAGVNIKMITGDNIDTARSIGLEVGLLKDETDLVLTSEEFNKMSDDEVSRILSNLKILARALPQDKSRLVKIAQKMNLVVGMTGDGVNDAPALKKSDVGFSMGSGSEVAKEASDIVILDDNLISVSSAILYGRTIFKSIRKFIIFQLTMNICALSISIIGPFIGVETPVTVVQMLWINMVMDTLAALAFSYEPALIEYMNEKPKCKDEKIINKYMLGEILFTGIYSSLLCIIFLKSSIIQSIYRDGNDNKYLMTAFFGLFIFMGIFNSFNARTHRLNIFSNLSKNLVFILVITFILFVQVYLIYFGGDVFRTYGLNLFEFEMMIFLSISVIPVDFIRKFYLKKRGIVGGV
ncbi:MAG: calcium-translocating P-type ATPase, PMCA-type [Bacilli bacterium]|nr:calcium-translocating P-type ATPase, PMCA-type [Bacilli bacterium]